MPKFKVEDIQFKEKEELYRLRPNLILGQEDNETTVETIFINGKFKRKKITSSIASRQTFREVISNSIDNVRRALKDGDVDPGVISVDLQTVKGDNPIITVSNGGHMPPFDIHPDLGVPVPQAIVGVFNVSTNYGDESENRLGGKNGLGSKGTNLFSKWFELTITDATIGQKYKQRFEEFEPFEPEIVDTKSKVSTFKVRYQSNDRLGTPNIYWYACDVIYAAVTSFDKIYLTMNGEEYDLSGLKFIDLLKFYPSSINAKKIKVEDEESEDESEEPEESSRKSPVSEEPKTKGRRKKREIVKPVKEINHGPEFPTLLLHWRDKEGNEVIVADIHKNFQFPRVQGWVNGIPCSQGTHIKEAQKVFIKVFREKLSSTKEFAEKMETLKLPPKVIRDNVLFLVKIEVPLPKFGSGQIKDIYVSPKVDLSLYDKTKQNGKEPETWGNWKNSHLVQCIKDHWKSEAEKELSKTDGKKTKHIKSKNYAVKANWAGSEKSDQTVLIGAEGDSAKKYCDEHRALYPNGNNVVGIFAFRGKVLNTLNASIEELLNNVELMELKKVIGLQEGLDYSLEENMKTLRYGKEFVIMADADDDGTHIKGLILLFFYTRYRTLLERGYVTAFFSPVIRVLWEKETYRFYRFEAYVQWCKENPAREKVTPKYYKGLASSEDDDVRDDFKVGKKIRYVIDKDADDYITLAFNEEYSDARKEWLASSCGKVEDLNDDEQFLSDFIDDDLVIFFHTSVRRAIPDIDGFKDVQRKLAWALRNAKKPTKVSILASRANEATKYHHGTAIEKAMMTMIQSFAGTNNVPLFTLKGQFGSRMDPKPAAARYPSTSIAPIYDKIFPKVDEKLLKIQYEEGEAIEPELLAPIIPMALVNGAKGVGAGWSTFIPSFHPKTVISNMKRIIQGKNFIKMIPSYKDYHGVITLTETGFKSQGILQRRGDSWRVSELPLWFWTKDFKDHLDMLLKPDVSDSRQPLIPMIKDYRQNDAKTSVVDYTIDGPTVATFIKLAKEEAKKNKKEYKPGEPMDADELYNKVFKLFKLEANHSMQNMVLLVNGTPKHFKTVEEIMRTFYDYRMPIYEQRYGMMVSEIEKTIEELKKKLVIARLFVEGKVTTNDTDLIDKIVTLSNVSEQDADTFLKKNSISVISKIAGGIKAIEEEIDMLMVKLNVTKDKTPKDLWLADLSKLEKAL